MTNKGVTNRIFHTEKILSPWNTYENGKSGGGVTRGDKLYESRGGEKFYGDTGEDT